MRKAKGQQLKHLSVAKCARLPHALYPSPPLSPPLTVTDDNAHYFDKNGNIVAWVDGILVAEPLEPVREDVIMQDGKIG
jgi:hypothetical protein